jgi:PTS system N-acetylglucosamine-specific IIC component
MLSGLQRIGRALMLPIAVLPVAALLLRLGQPDLLNIASMAAAGNSIFTNLGLLFAIGVAVGLARENHGAAGLASVVGYLVAAKGAEVLIPVPPTVVMDLAGQARDLAVAAYSAKELGKLSVPLGIISGLIAGGLYNRYSDIRLPAYLAFFGGRRFVPIASGFAGVIVAMCFGYGWPLLERGMDAMSQAVLSSGSLGLFAYGVLNRILIVTGLHHILNNLAWFLLGDYHGVTGDLNRFFAGDPRAGAFMSGFFPVMMFGLPAACLAMYHTARSERRRAVGGMLLSMALTSFLTGVTEPVEFSFMFLAPFLYAVHTVFTGLSMVLMQLLGVHLGFGFSAGLFDYVLNFRLATRPWLLLPVGLGYFALYYAVFRYLIVRLDLRTPGRELEELAAVAPAPVDGAPALAWIRALGGAANLKLVDACTTRLRLVIADQTTVDTNALRQLGARGFVRPTRDTLQVVVGPIADQVAGEIRAALGSAAREQLARRDTDTPPPRASARPIDTHALAMALGGRANIAAVSANASRLSVELRDSSLVDPAALRAAGARAVLHVRDSIWHVIIGPGGISVAEALQSPRAG